MSTGKPTLTDGLALTAAILFASAPGLMIAVGFPASRLPFSILLAALFLTLAKSRFQLPLSFGVSPGRWATILLLLTALGCLGTGLAYFNAGTADIPEIVLLDYLFMVAIFNSVTVWVVLPAIAYALAVLFFGLRLGPEPRKAQQ